MKKLSLLILAATLIIGSILGGCGDSAETTAPATTDGTTEQSIEPEISFTSDGVPIPPNVRPVIIVSGSDYDIGYQWFQQYDQIFGHWILEDMQQELTEEQLDALKAYQVILKEYAPEWIDIIKGMAQGATDAGVPLSYAEVMAALCNPRTMPDPPEGSDEEELPPDECSGFAAWGSATEDGSLVAGGLGDSGKVKFEHVAIVYPEDGNNFIISPYGAEPGGKWWSPCHPGMNNQGLAYVHHGAGTSGNESSDVYGVPSALAIMHTLRYAGNADEALDMLLAYPNTQKGFWADTSGDAFVLECRDPLTVRRAGELGEEDFLYATNNIVSESLGEFVTPHRSLDPSVLYVEHAGWIGSGEHSAIIRNLMIWNMLHNYHGLINVEFAKMMMRFPGDPPYPSLEEATETAPLWGEGWNTPIGSMNNEMVAVMAPDDGSKGLYWASSFRVGKVAYPFHGGSSGYYFPVDPTFTFYQLELSSSPSNAVLAAFDQARIDLYYAEQELRKLTYWDTPYAPLNEIYNKAATESISGEYYEALAKSTDGNESMIYYGKALRAYTRCQAYANQIYEALVPPATYPEDLGLEEWLGDWGDWAPKFPEEYLQDD